MLGATANLLKEKKKTVMTVWGQRALSQVGAARSVDSLTLANSLPLLLDHLSEALATNRKIDFRSVARHDAEAVRIGKLHGADRATSAAYNLAEVIFEYHLLREVIFEVLEEDLQLSKIERDIILDAVEQSVNDAAVQFTGDHADIQQKFVNTLTHDLRNPLSVVKMNAGVILRKPDDEAACLKAGHQIIAGVNRVDSMIQDLLEASRVRAGELPSFKIVDCHLDRLLQSVVDEMTLLYGERFHTKFQQGVTGKLGCDGVRRAVENLMGNAVKYGRDGGPITVSMTKEEDVVVIAVHNEGNPISPSDQKIVFGQFRRAQSAVDSNQPGWGLGLTLVQGVVTAHGGQIELKSDPEHGTSFTMKLHFQFDD